MSWIKKFWNWIRTDGLLHISECALITVSAYVIGCPWWAADVLALIIGLGYELIQRLTKKGTAEWHDVLCDLIGIGLADLVICLHLFIMWLG